jgi:uncharacterized membrane protein HdeD (DUF308 family)
MRSFLEHLDISLLLVGTFTMIRGISNKVVPKGIRAFEVSIGISAIIGGLYSLIHLNQESITQIWLVSLFFIAYGSGDIITGFTSHKAKVVKIEKISVGITILTLTGILLAYNGLSLTLIVVLHSINLLIMGIEIIREGVTHHKITRNFQV